MMPSLELVAWSIILVTSCSASDLSFPPGFKFGAASAAYQVEGAWNVSDKTVNIWDKLVHEHPELISDSSTGDVACDSYNLWERDIEMAEELGLHFYRFSISWSRLLPNGFANYISKDGQEYYDNLINGLLSKGIEPVVTIYHWELPQSLQDLGGWLNPLISDWFADYARVVFSLYADRVKTWLTINEPLVICDVTFNSGAMAPPLVLPDIGAYGCSKNVLMAHAKAWRIYDEEFRALYNGEVSLANHFLWFIPLTPEDEALAEVARENLAGRYCHAIFSKKGGWPPLLETTIEEVSKKKGYNKSILPAFTQEEIEFVRGTFDFLGLNHYTSRLIRNAEPGEELQPWPLGDAPDLNAKLVPGPNWPSTTSSWFYVLLAIKEDGVNVTGYTAWTLMDNFEWMDGYQSKFGLYEVDFDSPFRTRTPRASATYYKTIIKSHSLIDPKEVFNDEF